MAKTVPPFSPFALGDLVREKRSGKTGKVIGLRMPHKVEGNSLWKVRVNGFEGELSELVFELVVKPEDWTGSIHPATYWKKYKTTGSDYAKLRLAKALMEQHLIPEDFEFGMTRIGQGISQLKGEVNPISKGESDGSESGGEGNGDSEREDAGSGEDRTGDSPGQSSPEVDPDGKMGEVRGQLDDGDEKDSASNESDKGKEGEVEGKKEAAEND